MAYLEYERCKHKHRKAQKIYDSILSEKESILESQKDIAQVRLLDETLERMRETIICREALLSLAEKELMESKDCTDIVYRLRYMEHMKVKRIARIVHYSDTQVYRILQTIQEQIETIVES